MKELPFSSIIFNMLNRFKFKINGVYTMPSYVKVKDLILRQAPGIHNHMFIVSNVSYEPASYHGVKLPPPRLHVCVRSSRNARGNNNNNYNKKKKR